MNTSKNAYEIRLELLKMAHDDAYQSYHAKIDSLRCEESRQNKSIVTDAMIDKLQPTVEAITQRANELYVFVNKKD